MHTPTVDDATLDKLAELACISQEKRGVFYRSVRRSIGELWRGMKKKHPQPRQIPITKALNEYQAAVVKVRELLGLDRAAQSGDAHDYARSEVLTFLRAADDEDVSIDDATMTFICNRNGKGTAEGVADGEAFLDNLDLAIERARPEIVKAFPNKGRNHGVHGRPAIDLFLFCLLHTISNAGGYLSTSRTAGSSPRHMSKALKILLPYLPKDSPPKDASWAIEKAGIRVNRHLR